MLLLLSITWHRSATRSFSLALLTLLLTLAFTHHRLTTFLHGGTTFFTEDLWADYTAALILLSSLCILGLSWRNIARDTDQPPDEYPLLLLLGTLGAVTMVFSTNYMSFFLGLEILSLSLTGLVAFRHHHIPAASEAAMKYLILSGFSSAILLFGIGLAYTATGSLHFAPPDPANNAIPGLPLAATIMILTGIFFKLSAVPFHMWMPDVMEGASVPVAAFIAIVPKIAVFSALIRYFGTGDLPPFLHGTLSAIIILTILGGNLLALRQTNLTRLLACSSIAHVGYLLMAFYSPGLIQSGAVAIYLIAYTTATLGAFAVISALATQEGTDGTNIADWKGQFTKHPLLASAMSLMLLSLAGIPPGIGFFAKFEIAATGVEHQRNLLLAVLVTGSIIGLYYYLNIIRVMLSPASFSSQTDNRRNNPELTALVFVLAIIVVVGGIFPAWLIRPVLPASASVNTAPPPDTTQETDSRTLPP
ncbi:NADH-quinone oxidoreductase subunit N [Acetobacter oeni LMG 21952]|nr:NADH-quinone oxidoreductase subunit N [Acetobacter oeni LMG 21952]